MIFDTDVLIWIQRGNIKAAQLVEKEQERYISIQTYMELIQCSSSKKQIKQIREFLTDFNFLVLPLTEAIGHRAAVYIEEYSHVCGIRAGDAIIAATSIEKNMVLSTSNQKHFKAINDLQMKVFKP